MKRLGVVMAVIGSFFVYSQAQNSDSAVVVSILKKNNLNWDINKIATFKEDRIVTLDLDDEDIEKTGITTLTSEIGKLTELSKLTLNDNDLTRIPKELFNCTKLEILELKNNNIESIPDGISKLAHLKELDLRNNELKQLPAEIGKLKSIAKLQLWGNNLTTLPPQIGNLSKLKELYLMENHIKNLPESITKLKLTYLDFFYNYLDNPSKKIKNWLEKYDRDYKGEQFPSGTGKVYE